jgi:hypothetical protein
VCEADIPPACMSEVCQHTCALKVLNLTGKRNSFWGSGAARSRAGFRGFSWRQAWTNRQLEDPGWVTLPLDTRACPRWKYWVQHTQGAARRALLD